MDREIENDKPSEGEEASIGHALFDDIHESRKIEGEREWTEWDSLVVDTKVNNDIRKAIQDGWDKILDLRDIEWGSFKKHMGTRPYGQREIFGPWDMKYQERREEIFGDGYKADRYDRFYKENRRRETPEDPGPGGILPSISGLEQISSIVTFPIFGRQVVWANPLRPLVYLFLLFPPE